MLNTEKTITQKPQTTEAASFQTSNVLCVRQMKTYPFYRTSRSSCRYRSQPKVVPHIRLCGNWLQEAGFLVDKNVIIKVMENIIIIRPMLDAET